MADYQQLLDPTGGIVGTVLRRADNAYIPDDPANRDRAEYQAWLAEGNVPDPPDALPEPALASDDIATLRERVEALEHRVADLERM